MLISGVILAFVLGGLNVASQHLFQVSALHGRNRALCAAEVGVSHAQYQLEENPAFAGPLSATLADTSKYSVTIERVGTRAILHSVGEAAGQVQKLRVSLALDADTYRAGSSEALINVPTHAYINGIRSLLDPRSSRGNLFTNGDMTIDPHHRLSATGRVSVRGTFDDPDHVDGETSTDGTATAVSFTKASLLTGPFPGSFIPGSGNLSQNTRVNSDVELSQALYIPAGVTLHVQGDLTLHRGVTGEGTLVVEGTLILRGSDHLRDNSPKGLLVYAENDVVLAHPAAETDEDDPNGFRAPIDPVGQLFADMPEEVPYLLRQRLPVGAPTNVNFFAWYDSQEATPSAAFLEWRDGDGTTLNPGLPEHVTTWLTRASDMHNAIEDEVTP